MRAPNVALSLEHEGCGTLVASESKGEEPMQTSRRVDYALRLLVDLAVQPPGGRVTIGQVAERQKVPAAFLRRIVPELVAAGFVVTQRGERGGVTMAQPAGEVTVLQVLEALEGPVRFNAPPIWASDLPSHAALRELWRSAEQDLRAHLSTTTIAGLAEAAMRRAEIA